MTPPWPGPKGPTGPAGPGPEPTRPVSPPPAPAPPKPSVVESLRADLQSPARRDPGSQVPSSAAVARTWPGTFTVPRSFGPPRFVWPGTKEIADRINASVRAEKRRSS